MNLVAHSSVIQEEDENSKTVNYLLYLNQIPLETTTKMLQPHSLPKEAVKNPLSNIKEDKSYIQFLELYNKHKNLFERNQS